MIASAATRDATALIAGQIGQARLGKVRRSIAVFSIQSVDASAFAQRDYIGHSDVGAFGRRGHAEKGRRNVPLTTIICDDCHGFLVVACQHAFDLPVARRSKGYPITDSELQHFSMGVHLGKEPQACDDAMVEINEFWLGQLIDIDLHRMSHCGQKLGSITCPPRQCP
jgi:hypothetical protein